MHTSVMRWGRKVLRGLSPRCNVLEVGSYDVNGSLRSVGKELGFRSWTGIDIRPGPSVDLVLDITSQAPAGNWDIVVCTEVLEHVLLWNYALKNMWDILPVAGHLLLSTRSPGFPIHDYPSDYWRFTREQLTACFPHGCHLNVQDDPQAPGVLLHAQKLLHATGITLPLPPPTSVTRE